MEVPTKLQLAKDFIELSILISPDGRFMLPDYDKENKYQMLLYKAISNLKKEGLINVKLSAEGGMVITSKKYL